MKKLTKSFTLRHSYHLCSPQLHNFKPIQGELSILEILTIPVSYLNHIVTVELVLVKGIDLGRDSLVATNPFRLAEFTQDSK